VFFVILGAFSSILATDLRTELKIVQQTAETKYLENDQGYITKSIIESDENTGEVVIDLGLSNITNITEDTKERHENTEILIMVSENIVNEEEKLNTYVSYIETLSTKVFEKSSNTKIGILGIKGTIFDGEEDENGNMIWGENDEGTVNGSEDNAEIILKPSSSSDEIKSSLQNMNSSKTKYRTNLQAAIRLANKSYSDNVNKILICLYDSVPNIAIGVHSQISYGGWFSEYATAEEAATAKHNQIANKTNSEILNLKSNNIDFILLRPDDTSYDQTYYNSATGEFSFKFDGSPYVQKIYGTLENPTYGKMYSLNNDNLEKVVTEYIYQDIMDEIRADIKSAVIKEYFSDEILENFDITFDDEGIDTIDLLNNKYVVWNIGDLAGNETASLKYTLKIKDMKNEGLLDKVLQTNEKTEMAYINDLGVETTISSTSSPKIKLSEIKEELTAFVSYDPTTTTTGNVTATIETNKEVNEVEGWTLSEDGKILTKEYSANTTETVHLVDMDNMTKDVVIKIENIVPEEPETPKEPETPVEPEDKDPTTTDKYIPDAGARAIITIMLIVCIIGIIAFVKLRKFKDV